MESEQQAPQRPARTVTFGRVAYPGIGYRMGGRQMVSIVMSPVSYVATVGEREVWDPLAGTGTNRKEDKKHKDGIAKYIDETPDYVLNSILVYVDPRDASFQPDDPDQPMGLGVLYLEPGTKFKVGDGGHRTSAYSDVVSAHAPVADEVFERLRTNGQPIIVVLDDDPARRAQDFKDLQNNAKPLTQSIAQSMDKRQAINRLLVDKCIKGGRIPVLAGPRIEFLSDSPGKLSAKIMGFKTLRYATGLLLIGTGFRSTKAWEEAVDSALITNPAAEQMITDFWIGYGRLPQVESALTNEKGMVILRENTWLASANVMYAVASAAHELITKDGYTVDRVMKALVDVDLTRAGKTLDGTLVEPGEDGRPPKARTGRDAWEGAANVIANLIRGESA